MNIKVFKDYEEASDAVAAMMTELLRAKPNAMICLASGDSPALACELFCKKAKDENLDTSKFFLVGLDEWVGLAPDTFGSCRNDFQKRVIDPLQLPASQYHFFNALSADLDDECMKMDEMIQQKGGIDMMIVGIGMNGHIGFNEPGVDMTLHSHVITLDPTTISVGQKYFKKAVNLEKGITLGLAHLMKAREVIMMANGTRKADVICRAAEGVVSNAFPATIMQQHANGKIIIDEAAAATLNIK